MLCNKISDKIVGCFVVLQQQPTIFMTTSSRIIYAATNKYLVASVIFAVIILFTDHNNLFEQMQRQSELSDLATKKRTISRK